MQFKRFSDYTPIENLDGDEIIPIVKTGTNGTVLAKNLPVSIPTQTAIDEKADGSALVAHIDDINNPHQVTKAQVGLANANNTSDSNKPVSTAQAAAIAIVQNDVDAHEAATDNPHAVTKSQVGLGNVDNTSDTDKPVSIDQAAAIADVQTALDSHEANQSNPHQVTKTQVGLGSADNTSDINKPVSTSTQTALDTKQNVLGFTPENTSNKGQLNGYAGLDESGKVPAAQLPSFVDDVIEYANLAAFPVSGSSGVIYVAADTNKTYRWSGSSYFEISPSEVTSVNGRSGGVTGLAENSALVAHTSSTSNPHSVTKSQVGLGSADNTADTDKPISTAAQAALDLKASLASPALTGVPTAPTASASTNTTQVATTAFVESEIVAAATPDASSSVKGKVQIAGDLSGSASSILVKSRAYTKTVGPVGSVADYIVDGTADNVEIQAAHDAVGIAGGGVVWVRPGTYNIATRINMNYDNVSIVGERPGAVIFQDSHATGLDFLIRSSVTTATAYRYNVGIENLTLNGLGKTDVGFTSHNAYGLTVRRCKIGNMKAAGNWALNITSIDPNKNSSPSTAALAQNILVSETECYGAGASQDLVAFGHGRDALFWKCIFRDPLAGTAGLLSISDGTRENVVVDSCIFSETTPTATAAIYTSVTGVGTKVVNCEVRGMPYAIALGGFNTFISGNTLSGSINFRSDTVPSYAKVISNTIDTTGRAVGGISFRGTDHTIFANQVKADNAGIRGETGSDRCTISNNKIRDVNIAPAQNSGIEIRGASNTVVNNDIQDTRGTPAMYRGIYISGGTDTSLSGNIIAGATSAAITGANSDVRTYVGPYIVLSGVATVSIAGSRTSVFNELTNAAAVNYINVSNAATGTGPLIQAAGADSNVALTLQTQNGGALNLRPGSNNTNAVRAQSAGGTINAWTTDTTNSRFIAGPGTGPHSTLQSSGSFGLMHKSVADADYTIVTAQTGSDCLVTYTTLTAPRTVTLPTAASVAGRIYFVTDGTGNAGSSNITVATVSSQTINGSTTYAIDTNYGYVGIYSDGTNWHILAKISGGSGAATTQRNWRVDDQGLVGWSFDAANATGTRILQTAARLHLIKIPIGVATTISNVYLDVTTAGTVLTSAGVAVYQNGTLLAQSADMSTTFQSTNTATCPLTGAPISVAVGYIYVAVWASGTVLPTFASGPSRSNINVGLGATASRFGFADTGITTTAPGTLGTVSATSNSFWAAVG